MIALPVRPRILVVALRRLGDVLLTTPLIRSCKHAWPDAAIDALVFRGTEGILEGNPDIAGVLTLPERTSAGESLALLRKVWRAYDLAISTQSGDRPTLFAWGGGRRSAGFVESSGLITRVKRFALTVPVPIVGGVHRVAEVLRLAEALGAPGIAEVVPPKAQPARKPDRPYAVIHAAPMFRYKRWTAEGWRALATALAERGLAVVATTGPGEDERRYLDHVWGGAADVQRLGPLPWGELAGLIGGAQLYAGPDTSVTHLAAATGTPTVALYGPTDPRLWGPWPAAGLSEPWAAAGTVQSRGNVWLVQNPPACPWSILPCQQEGCERHLDSYSRCLDELHVSQVLSAVDAALAATVARRGERRY
ncbi:MAG: glycosyltransferase family 9 protein [Alphaproteobacteria bacterium]